MKCLRRKKATLVFVIALFLIYTIINHTTNSKKKVLDSERYYFQLQEEAMRGKVEYTTEEFVTEQEEILPLHESITKQNPQLEVDHFNDLFDDIFDLKEQNKKENHIAIPDIPIRDIPINDASVQKKSVEEVQNQKERAPKPDTSWLLDNRNVMVSRDIASDVLPGYYDPGRPLPEQFEEHLSETRLVMEERKDLLKKHCVRKRQYLKRKQDFLFYFPELGAAWCPVFKAGSTNWKQFFCKIYFPDLYERWKKVKNDDPYCPLGEMLDFTVRYRNKKDREAKQNGEEWQKGVNEAVKFLTVRHPYERLVSVYNNKFKNCDSRMFTQDPEKSLMVSIMRQYRKVNLNETQKDPLLQNARSECLKPSSARTLDPHNPYMNPMGITFYEMVQHLRYSAKHGKFPDYHWMVTTRACDLCQTQYDVIEKFETLDRDHYYLLTQLGMQDRYSEIGGVHANPSEQGSSSSWDKVLGHFSTLDEGMLWDLWTIYHDDFELFGYKPHFRCRKKDPDAIL